MDKIELIKHAAKQEDAMRAVLDEMSKACADLDMVHENGLCTSCFIDYDEQDMLNACSIFYSIASNYAIKHGILTSDNVTEKISKFAAMVKDTFGLDCAQEIRSRDFVNKVKENIKP